MTDPADIVEQMIVERATEALVEAKATIEAQQAEIAELRRIAQARKEHGREQRAEIMDLREALEWYGENARLCRLIHSEGDAGRHALSEDGGKRARAALQAEKGEG